MPGLVTHDCRIGLRSLLRTPGLSLVAVLSLALGIGAATAMFSVIHAVVIDPFPYRDVDTLMSITSGAIAPITLPANFWNSPSALRSSTALSPPPSAML
jgi:hypothetical protein